MFILDGIFVNAATVLTTGVFLSGYIVYLKGSDFLVGILNNAPTWASIAAIISFVIFERMKKRKLFLIILNIVSRILICFIIFIPLTIHDNGKLLFIVSSMVIAGNIVWSFYNIGVTVMMIGLLPEEMRNRYVYVRTFWLRISFTAVTITMGIVLDWFNKSYIGFLIVFIVSMVFSIADVIVIAYVKEPSYGKTEVPGSNLDMFFEPVKDKKYRGFLIFVFFYYLCLTMASSFTPLYQIRYMKFDYSFISAVNVICYIFMIICTNFWSRIERMKGLKYVMGITSICMAAELLIDSFLTNRTYYLLFIAPVISGIGNSGFNIGLFNHRYEIMPEDNKTIYEGWFGAVFGLSMLVAPVIGSLIMDYLPDIHNSLYQYSKFQLLYFIAFISSMIVIFFRYYMPHWNIVKVNRKQKI